jgi:two-component system, NtrC family, nitrogen regulation sensor histidine kinase NtrY
VSLRRRAVAYLVVLHLVFAGLAVYLFLNNPFWLLAIELFFIGSLAIGLRLSREMYRQFGLAAEGLRLIRDEEFTSRFLPVGQREIDEIIAVYNRMVDHLRAERVRVAEQHQFLSQVLDVSPSGVVILDFDQHVSTVNPAAERLLDRRKSEMVGRRLDELRSPLGDALASLKSGEARLVGLLGARRVKCHHGTFVDRGFSRSFLLIEELTDELRQFERAAYEKLIRVMSHEVNNTVTASNSLLHSSLTYSADLDPGNRRDFEEAIGVVIERTEQLSSFMRRFADVFRLPAPVLQPCDLVTVLQGFARLLAARADAAGIRWRWEFDAPSIYVEVDRGQIEQALLNILKNSVEALDGHGTITVRVLSGVERTILTIEDSGPGIAPEAQSNLFTPFFSTKPHGQGIGLTLIQEILAGHGFHYALERTPESTTRFSIVFGPTLRPSSGDLTSAPAQSVPES